MQRIELPDDEGHWIRLMKMSMPMFVSNRSTVNCLYRHQKADGTKCITISSRGNDEIAQANMNLIGSDTINNNIVTQMSWKPFDGGMDLSFVIKMDA